MVGFDLAATASRHDSIRGVVIRSSPSRAKTRLWGHAYEAVFMASARAPATSMSVSPNAPPSLGRKAGTSARREYHRRRRAEWDVTLRNLPTTLSLIVLASTATYLVVCWTISGLDWWGRHGPRAAGELQLSSPGSPLTLKFIGSNVAAVTAVAVAVMTAVVLLKPRQSTVAWRRGAEGEERVGRMLERLRYLGWDVQHDVAVTGTRANIDHLVSSPYGLFVIDTKNYRGRLRLDRGVLRHGHTSFERELESVRWQADFIKRTCARGLPVRCVICVVGAELPRPRLVFNDVVVVSGVRSLMSEFHVRFRG